MSRHKHKPHDKDDRIILTADEQACCKDIANQCRDSAVQMAKLGQTYKARLAMKLYSTILRMIRKSKTAHWRRAARLRAAQSCQASDGTSTEVSP